MVESERINVVLNRSAKYIKKDKGSALVGRNHGYAWMFFLSFTWRHGHCHEYDCRVLYYKLYGNREQPHLGRICYIGS